MTLPISGTPVNIDFDPTEIAVRYAREREARVRPDGLAQFEGLDDELECLDADMYTVLVDRPAVDENVDVIVLGGGFGGVLAGAHLRERGFDDIRLVERAGDFGGTWYWNRYPGVQCDIESYSYLPLLEETGYMPSKWFADGDEIRDYVQLLGRQYDLYRAALFQTTVTAATWLPDVSRWEVCTDRGDVLRGRFLVRANGPLNKPQLPRVPGIGSFAGKVFHTSRWDYDYTGGDQRGNLHGLRDKRVAIVGTGATSVQAVPYLAEGAAELFVVQRTPSAVGVRANRPTDPQWAAGLKPGWQADRIDNFNSFVNFVRADTDLVADGWTDLFTRLTGQHLVDVPVETLAAEDRLVLQQIADYNAMRRIHRRIDDVVADAATAEALKPWFGSLCKRPCFNDEYLPAFNRPNVTLVAAPTGLDAITSTGLVANGVPYDVDCIIFATGFEVGSVEADRFGYDVTGRDGLLLSEYFADGQQTLHGFYSYGFPNFFELGLSQNGYIANFNFMLDRKARHVARLIDHAWRAGIAEIEPIKQAQDVWAQIIREKKQPLRAYLAQCTPGYYNGQGQLKGGIFDETYGGGELEYWQLIDDWWDAGTFKGLKLTPAPVQQT
jgi:cyclohexanone monooxygenase